MHAPSTFATIACLAAAATLSSASAGVTSAALDSRDPWQLNGNTTLLSRQLALTTSTAHRLGTAFIRQKQDVASGFEAAFAYTITGGNNLAGEGLAFVIQNQSASALGLGGRELGLGGLRNTVAIGIRTGANPAIEIRQAGSGGYMYNSAPIASVGIPSNLLRTADGQPNHIRISYVPGAMNVFLDGQLILRNVRVNLGNASAFDENGQAWVGFGAANGPFDGERHAITSFNFTSIPTPGAAAGLALVGLAAARRRRTA